MILATDEDTKVKDAVALRFKELCEERNISPNALAVRSGVTPSTVYSMLDSSQQSVTVPTVKKLCDGLGIMLVDFFLRLDFHCNRSGNPINNTLTSVYAPPVPPCSVDRPDCGGVSVMLLESSSVLNAIHLIREQTNKAHRQN